MTASFETREDLNQGIEDALNTLVGLDFEPGTGEKLVLAILRINGFSEETAPQITAYEAVNNYVSPWIRGEVLGQISTWEMLHAQNLAWLAQREADRIAAEEAAAAQAEADRIAAEEEAARLAAEEAANQQP